jgi:hypothetical protein
MLCVTLPIETGAQSLSLEPAAAPGALAVHQVDGALAARRSTTTFPPPNHCCSKKGALIGAAIGAGIGAALAHSWCDGHDCASSYLGSMAILGGVGAFFGALTAHPSRGTSKLPAPPRIVISPAVGEDNVGALVLARF